MKRYTPMSINMSKRLIKGLCMQWSMEISDRYREMSTNERPPGVDREQELAAIEAAMKRMYMFHCANLQAKITSRSCCKYQDIARRAAKIVNREHKRSDFDNVTHQTIHRFSNLKHVELRAFIACGRCAKCKYVTSSDIDKLRDIARAQLLWFEEKSGTKPRSGGKNMRGGKK